MAHGISQEKLYEIGLEPEQVSGTFVTKKMIYQIYSLRQNLSNEA